MANTSSLKLFSYWRSSCSYRVRIVLNIKRLDYEYIGVNLLKNEQTTLENIKRNPMKLVPTLQVQDLYIPQSMAIMEYLDEVYPEVPLLPKDPFSKAVVRAMCMIFVADTQPLQNLKVLNTLEANKKKEWAVKVISDGLEAFEKSAEVYSKRYSFGDSLTLADACLVPQVYNAIRFEIDILQYPTISKIVDNLNAVPEVEKAAPQHMPDAQ